MLIAVPFRDAGCKWRRRAWERTHEHLAELGEVRVFDDGGALFSRAGSLNLAFTLTDADVVVACDADLIVPLDALSEAVGLAATPGMVIPFDRINYLDQHDGVCWRFKPCENTPLLGGCNVLSRETWLRAGGWDNRFRGWGSEDVAFAQACAEVAPIRRLNAKAVHLYHPKPRSAYTAAEKANGELLRRLDAR